MARVIDKRCLSALISSLVVASVATLVNMTLESMGLSAACVGGGGVMEYLSNDENTLFYMRVGRSVF